MRWPRPLWHNCTEAGAGFGVAGMNRSPNEATKYFRALGHYVWVERRLMAVSTLFGVIGLCLPFAFPHIIGALIDRVILGHSGDLKFPLSDDQRIHELW